MIIPPEEIIGAYNLFMIMVFFCQRENVGEIRVRNLGEKGKLLQFKSDNNKHLFPVGIKNQLPCNWNFEGVCYFDDP